MGIICKISGCILAFTIVLLSYAQAAEAKTKTVREVSFYEPDYEVVEVVDVDYQKELTTQISVDKEIRQHFIDINEDTEPSLREPAAKTVEAQDISFENSYRQFQKHYGELTEELDL